MIQILKRTLGVGLHDRRNLSLYERYRNYTMVPQNQFLENLQLASTCSTVSGCVVECGVWRGGMIAAISEILGNGREYFLFDSFEGLPKATAIDGVAAQTWQEDTSGASYFNNCKAEQAFAKKAMALAGIPNASIIKGWFKETLPQFDEGKRIALLRLDGDWFESTMECLEHLYPKVSNGGLIVVDDYFMWDGCARAVHQYLGDRCIADRIRCTPQGVCYLRKEGDGRSHGFKAASGANQVNTTR